ncbi:MAG: MraY family glycosyltransferase, partial [candidate division WOR-3 bacterium]
IAHTLGEWLLAGLVLLIGMNAMNLEDGLDGLVGGETLVSMLGFGTVLIRLGERSLAGLCFVLAGGLAGFLLLNWHPARVFLGDGGSHMLGAVLAGLAITIRSSVFRNQRSVLAVLLMGIPLLDIAWVIINRLVQGRNLFAGDREHLYDLLRRRGLSVPATVALLVTAQIGVVTVAVRGLVSGH